MLRWCSATAIRAASDSVSLEWSQSAQLFSQFCTLRWCSAAFTSMVSELVSRERSQVQPLLQSERLRRRRAISTPMSSDGVSLERSQAPNPSWQSPMFWARSDDWAHRRMGQRLRHATCAQRYFERLIFIFAAFQAIEESRYR